MIRSALRLSVGAETRGDDLTQCGVAYPMDYEIGTVGVNTGFGMKLGIAGPILAAGSAGAPNAGFSSLEELLGSV